MKLYLGDISSNCAGLHEFCIKGVGNLDEYTPGLIDVCEASSPRLRTLELEVHKASAGTLEKITGQFPSLKCGQMPLLKPGQTLSYWLHLAGT